MRRDSLKRAERSEPGDRSNRIHLAHERKPKRMRLWQKIVLWFVGSLFTLIVLLIVAGAILLHTKSFHRYVVNKVDAVAGESTGARVHIADFTLRLSPLSLDLYRISIHGTESDAEPPLLAADHIGIRVKILSILKRKWNLRDIVIDHPVAHVAVNAQGQNNFPTPPKKSKSNTSIFDLAIQHFLIDRGEIYYNDRKSRLDADLHNVNLETNFDNAATRYYGTLEYRDGVVKSANFSPVTHDFSVRFEATPSRFTVNEAVLKTGSSHAKLQATVENFNSPRVDAKYEVALNTQDARRILHNSTLPVGTIRLEGVAKYESRSDVPMLNALYVAGSIESPALAVHTSSFHGEIRSFAASYKLANGNAEVKDLRALLLGGTVNGKLTVRDVAGARQGNVQAVVKNVSLAAARTASGTTAAKEVGLAGAVSADLDATWHGSLEDLIARANATINAAASPARRTSGSTQPTRLDGVIHAQYAAKGSQLTLRQSYLRTAQTQLILDGTASAHSNLQIRMQSNDLHELEVISDQFRTPQPGQTPQPLNLYGRANFNGTLSGPVSNPRLEGQLTAADLQLKGSQWRSLRTTVGASASQASLTNGELDSAAHGKIVFNLAVGLKHWAYSPESPLKVNVSATALSAADLAKTAGLQTPVSGTLAMHIALQGTQANPVGQGTVSLTQASISGESIQALNLRFNGNGEAVHATLQAQMPAGVANGDVTYMPKSEAYEARLQATNFHLDQLQSLKTKNIQLAGVMDFSANGRGTLKSPELEASLKIPQLQVQKETMKDFSFTVKVENQVATLALDSQAVNTFIRAHGTVGITGDYPVDVRLDTGRIPLQPLLASYAPQMEEISGETEFHASVRGPLKDKARLAAHAEIPVLSVNYRQLQIAAASPIKFDYQDGTLRLEHSAIKGTGTDLEFQGSVPVSSTAAMSVTAQGTLDLRLAQMVNPDLNSSGQIKFDLNSAGNRSNPDVQGQIHIVNANFMEQDAPLGLENANGTLTLTRSRLNIANFTGTVGGGTVEARGGMAYRPNMQVDVGVSANNVRLRYPDGLRTLLSANISITGTPNGGQIGGQVDINRISFTPDFDLANFAGQFSGGESAPPSTSPFMESIRLNIGVQTTSGINLASSKVSLQGSANLRVEGTAADPVILGRANLTGGELFFMSNRYVIQGGTISFLNPVHTEPVLNLRVTTVVQNYNINLTFRGPVDRLDTTYASDPALPPVDIIHLLAFGSTTEAAGGTTSSSGGTPGNLGAESVLAQGITSQLSSRVEKIAGISHLSVDPVLGGGTTNQNPGARVTVQQRVTSNLYITFQTDVTSTQNNVIEGEYKINKQWSVTASRNQNGGFGVDGRYHKEF